MSDNYYVRCIWICRQSLQSLISLISLISLTQLLILLDSVARLSESSRESPAPAGAPSCELELVASTRVFPIALFASIDIAFAEAGISEPGTSSRLLVRSRLVAPVVGEPGL
jgi:hypothetical protein